jgi:hypothetical protein
MMGNKHPITIIKKALETHDGPSYQSKSKRKLIEKVIDDCFHIPPAKKAAMILHALEITEDDLLTHYQGLLNSLPEPQLLSTRNALRDLERNQE